MSPEKLLSPQLVRKIISTTLREGWPPGSSVREGNKDSDLADRVRFVCGSGLGFLEMGRLNGGVLGLGCEVVSTMSLLLQLED